MEKYEIEFINNPFFYNRRLVQMITGLTFDEVEAVTPSKNSWQIRFFKKAFRDLGFNCSERMKQFDPLTELPALVMIVPDNGKNNTKWYSAVYNDGKLFVPGTGQPFPYENAHHVFVEPVVIKSMLQVWI